MGVRRPCRNYRAEGEREWEREHGNARALHEGQHSVYLRREAQEHRRFLGFRACCYWKWGPWGVCMLGNIIVSTVCNT